VLGGSPFYLQLFGEALTALEPRHVLHVAPSICLPSEVRSSLVCKSSAVGCRSALPRRSGLAWLLTRSGGAGRSASPR
jgi:hypothetical protein